MIEGTHRHIAFCFLWLLQALANNNYNFIVLASYLYILKKCAAHPLEQNFNAGEDSAACDRMMLYLVLWLIFFVIYSLF